MEGASFYNRLENVSLRGKLPALPIRAGHLRANRNRLLQLRGRVGAGVVVGAVWA